MLLSAILATTLLTSCGNAPAPSLENIEPTVTNIQFVSDPQATRAAPNVNATGGMVKFEFNTAMDRASVENAINIFKGVYDESLNPLKPQKLQLTSTCNGRWNINNPNDTSVSFHWSAIKTERDENESNDTDKDNDTDEDKLPKTAELSDGVVPANSQVQFNTVAGKSLLRVFVNKKQHGSKVAKKALCTTPLYTFTWSADSRSVSVKPVTPLVVGQKYTAVLSTNARIANGSRSVKEPVNYSFVASGREIATLQPGGSVTFANGIRVSMSTESSDVPIDIYVEEVPASAAKFPIPSEYTAIGSYYRIGAVGEDTSVPFGFQIDFPIPATELARFLGIIFLTPEAGANRGWDGDVYSGRLAGSNGMASTTSDSLYHEGSIFVLAKDPTYLATPSSISNAILQTGITSRQNQAQFNVLCTVDKCSDELVKNVLRYANESYSHWINAMELTSLEAPDLDPRKQLIISPINYSNNNLVKCRVGVIAQYDPVRKTIYFCANKNGNSVALDIKETAFHEMFHATQRGISNGSKLPKNKFSSLQAYDSTVWIIEGTASAAANSGVDWKISDNHKGKLINSEMYSTDPNQNRFKYYRAHDFWIHSLSNVFATKDLFKVNSSMKYDETDLDHNANLVSNFFKSQNYAGGLREAYWKWVKSQSLELNKDFLEEANPCSIFRNETQNEVGTSGAPSGNSVDIDFDATFLKKDATAIAKIPKTLPATPLTSRLWNFTFTNVPDKRYVHFKLSSNQPNAKFHIYKLPKDLPAGYTGCQDPDGNFDYTDNVPANTPDSRDFEVDNDTRIVVLGSNLEYMNPADLKLEMGILKPKIAVSPTSINASFDPNINTRIDGIFKVANIGDVNSRLEYQLYAPGTYPNPNPKNNLDINGFPEAQGVLLDNMISFNYYAPQEIVKENNVDLFEHDNYVSPRCAIEEGDYTIPISISSKTGDFLADGTPVFDTNVVIVHLSCIKYLGCSFCRKVNVPPIFPNLTIQTTPSTSRRIMLKNVENTLTHMVVSKAQTTRASNHQTRGSRFYVKVG